MLRALAARRPIEHMVALVVAHPDDETLGVGGSLHLMPRLLLVHITDGAPRTLGDAAREGYATPESYARARADELALALALSGTDPVRETLDIPDQQAVDHVDAIAQRLKELLHRHGVEQVLTHAYEGGHPDHDAAAFAVRATGAEVFEFTGYHAGPNGQLKTSSFLPATERTMTSVALSPSELARKTAMLACFQSQRAMLSRFDPATERFRAAPIYDFSRAPHPGRLLYEEWGWMTGDEWRRRAARARCAA